MSEEEFILACKEWDIDINFKNIKDKIYYMYCIAGIKGKGIKITKISKRSCYVKVIRGQGIETSKWATMRNYDNNLKHNNGKFKIIEFEIV